MKDFDNVIKTQVVIIGAGPTGLSLAAQLIRYDIDFIILEKNIETTILSKAIAVQSRTLEIFQELGLSEKAINEGRLTTGLRLFYKGKKRAAMDLKGLGEGLSAFPFALSLEQSKTEKLLAGHLIEKGKNIKWNAELIHFEQTDTAVFVYYKEGRGQEIKIEASDR